MKYLPGGHFGKGHTENFANLKANYTVEIDDESLAQFDYAPSGTGYAP